MKTDYINELSAVRQSNKEFIDFMCHFDFRPSTVIDVGVAFGTPEIYNLNTESLIVLIEPVIEFRTHIEHIEACHKTITYWAAAAAEDGEIEIWVTPDMTTSSLLIPMNATKEVKRRTVPCWKLDTLRQRDKWPGPFLLKIDTQGAELKVLDGSATLLQDTEIVLLEVSLFPFSPGLPDFFEVLKYMKQLGFVIYDLFNGHNRPLDGARGQIDVAFVKEDGVFRKDCRWGTPEQCKKFLDCKFTREIYRKLNQNYI